MSDRKEVTMYPAGKLPAPDLAALLGAVPRRDPRVIVGPQPGEDAAVIAMAGGRAIVVTTDPITFAADRIGWYAVHVNANDVAVMGAIPRWFFLTLLLPAGQADETMLSQAMSGALAACESLGVALCGGHTEITPAVGRPIAVGQMVGEVEANRLLRKTALAPGDVVILTQSAAIEGTALLAREQRPRLEGRVAADVLDRAAAWLDDPGISVVLAARAAAETGVVRAMHDPTEGGVASGLLELAAAAGLGIEVDGDALPIRAETTAICEAVGVDPLKLIASGALLIGVPEEGAPTVLEALSHGGVPAVRVAELTQAGSGGWITRHGRRASLVLPDRDELARVFED